MGLLSSLAAGAGKAVSSEIDRNREIRREDQLAEMKRKAELQKEQRIHQHAMERMKYGSDLSLETARTQRQEDFAFDNSQDTINTKLNTQKSMDAYADERYQQLTPMMAEREAALAEARETELAKAALTQKRKEKYGELTSQEKEQIKLIGQRREELVEKLSMVEDKVQAKILQDQINDLDTALNRLTGIDSPLAAVGDDRGSKLRTIFTAADEEEAMKSAKETKAKTNRQTTKPSTAVENEEQEPVSRADQMLMNLLGRQDSWYQRNQKKP